MCPAGSPCDNNGVTAGGTGGNKLAAGQVGINRHFAAITCGHRMAGIDNRNISRIGNLISPSASDQPHFVPGVRLGHNNGNWDFRDFIFDISGTDRFRNIDQIGGKGSFFRIGLDFVVVNVRYGMTETFKEGFNRIISRHMFLIHRRDKQDVGSHNTGCRETEQN